MERALEPSAAGSQTSLADRIREAVESGELQLPPLPDLLVRLRTLLDDESVDAPSVARLVRNEPAIVASLLKIANAAAYAGLQEVKDLNQAIARLGLKQVGSLITALMLKEHFRSNDPEKRRLLQGLWDHAVATGLAARRLALQNNGDPEQAFLAGLLHDTGRLLVLKAVDFLEDKDKEQFTGSLILELMDALHTELGYETLTSWKLPEAICRIARHHHDEAGDDADGLLMQVQAGDVIARKLGAHLAPSPSLNLSECPAIERMRMSDLELAALLVDIEDEFAEVRSLF